MTTIATKRGDGWPITPTAIDAIVSIETIRVVDRHRKVLGDLRELADSIDDIGLLHPITLTRESRLIAGQRRLEACRLLGWTEVPVRFVDSLADAERLLRAERDENTCRLDMRPSEKVALAEALRDVKRHEAKQRQREHRGTAPGRPANTSENFTQVSRPGHNEVREQLGEIVGMSGITYARAREVVKATEHEDPKVRKIANAAMEEMDRTGKVTPAYDKVARATGRATAHDGGAPEPVVEVEPKIVDEELWVPSRNSNLEKSAEQRRKLIRHFAVKGYTSAQIGDRAGGLTGRKVREYAREAGIAIPADEALGRSHRAIDSNRVVREIVQSAEHLGSALQYVNYDELDRAEIADWIASLSKSIQTLTRLNKRLKETIQ